MDKAPWDMIYYAALGLLYLRIRCWLFLGVMAGLGVELVLVRIMVTEQFICAFCAAILLSIYVLLLCTFPQYKISKLLSITLLFYIAFSFMISGAQVPRGAQDRLQSPTSILAALGDREITAEDVVRPLTSKIHKLRQEVYEMKDLALESAINDILLETEAQERGITFESLIAEIREGIFPPAPHVIDHYYETKLYQQWGTWKGSEQETKVRILEYLNHREANERVVDHCDRLRKKHPVHVFLKPPPLPLTQVRVSGDPTMGPSNAPVTVVEFSDHICPSCRKGQDIVKQVAENYKGKIRWVFKNYLLERHPEAKELALAARCAHAQGRFWAYHDLLFSGEKKPGLREAVAHVVEVGLNISRFHECMSDPAFLEALEQDIADARAAGISSTPTIIINRRMRTGISPFEEFSEMIEKALKEAEVTATHEN